MALSWRRPRWWFLGAVLTAALAAVVLPAVAGAAAAITEFSAGISAGSSPYGITAGPDGNLWFTELSGNRIGRITPAGVVTEFSAGISAGSYPQEIAAGPDGNLWFTEGPADRIGRITPAGVVTEFAAGISAGSDPGGITAGPDGNLWFTEGGADRIGRITPAGVVTEFSTGISANKYPSAITAGPDGNLWFTESSADSPGIGRITPAGVVSEFSGRLEPDSAPVGITAGPDGSLWFIELNRSQVGRITLAGVVSELPTPSPSSAPEGITAGPDGNLWFTESNLLQRVPGGDRIGRISTSLPPAVLSGGAPTISGSPVQGQTLTEAHGSYTNDPASYAYQWQDCDDVGANCVAIAGATSLTYTLTSSDVGDTIRVQETASNAAGSSGPVSSARTAVVAAASAPVTPGSPPNVPAGGPPNVTGYGITNRTFVVGGARTPTFGRAARANKPKQKTGTTFRYTLSEAASVEIVISERVSGRREGRSCVAPAKKLRQAKRCTRVITIGTLVRASHQGADRVAFSGRIGSRALKPGGYQATITATDADKRTSQAQTISFTILKR